jgi:D-alanyl-D-alanine dipeptidase
MSPHFDEPCLTEPATEVVARLKVAVPEALPIPELNDPEAPSVTDSGNEPLVEVSHSRIAILGNYRRAGWRHAREGCWLRRPVAGRLARVADRLPERWGLAVFDGWRPLDLQVELYEAALADPTVPPGLFAVPDAEPSRPPPHLTGCAVDLTLTLDGVALAPGTGFDDLTLLARADALEGLPGPDRDVRRLLYWSMRAAGFVVFDAEWWHFEYGTRRWGAITGNQPRFGPTAPPD